MTTFRSPLVSIMIPNYHHSAYLPQCIESALNQTHEHTEVIVLDNDSSDDSVAVAARYASKGVRVCKNPNNYFNGSYELLARQTIGKYLMLLAADDYLLPGFVERAIDIMETHSNVGYVHEERAFLRGDRLLEIEPFYKCSFTCSGRAVMPIYMMSSVAHPSQGIVRRSVFDRIGRYRQRVDHVNADRMLWFLLASVSDYGYVNETASVIRVGADTETAITAASFYHPMALAFTIREMAEYAALHGAGETAARKQPALDKLARELLEFPAKLINGGNFTDARRYLLFCRMISRAVERDERFSKLSTMVEQRRKDDTSLLPIIDGFNTFNHRRNYDPPVGFLPLEVNHGN